MTRFSGLVGYNLGTTETRPGVWEDNIVEKVYFGEVKNPARQAIGRDDSVNDVVTLSNSIEIMADEFADDNFYAIKYVNWKGKNWVVDSVGVRRPRLILRLGGVYSGPTPAASTP